MEGLDFCTERGISYIGSLDAVDRLGSSLQSLTDFGSAGLWQTDVRCVTEKFWCPVLCGIGWVAGSVCSTSGCCLVIGNELKLGGLWAELLKPVCLATEGCHCH